jgi:hypothetical protein
MVILKRYINFGGHKNDMNLTFNITQIKIILAHESIFINIFLVV